MSDEQHLRRAIGLASSGMDAELGGPFGAVIVRNGQVIAEGQNQVTSGLDPTAHAEIVAIRRACIELSDFALTGCTIYSSCEPCPMCLSAIYWSRLTRIVFAAGRKDAAAIGFDDEFLYQELPRALQERTLPTVQLLHEEATVVMKRWTSVTPGRRY